MSAMSDLKPPEISADAHPQFTDDAACAAWLAELPLVNVAPSQIRLLEQLRELNRYSLPADARLKILELLREPVYFVQEQQLRKLVNKPFPLTQAERGILAHVADLWQELLIGYLHCLGSAGDGRQSPVIRGATRSKVRCTNDATLMVARSSDAM